MQVGRREEEIEERGREEEMEREEERADKEGRREKIREEEMGGWEGPNLYRVLYIV